MYFITAISIICGTLGKFDAEYLSDTRPLGLSACRQILMFFKNINKHVISKILITINQTNMFVQFGFGHYSGIKKIIQHTKFMLRNKSKQIMRYDDMSAITRITCLLMFLKNIDLPTSRVADQPTSTRHQIFRVSRIL